MNMKPEDKQQLYNEIYSYCKERNLIGRGPQGCFLVLDSEHTIDLYNKAKMYGYDKNINDFKSMLSIIFNHMMFGGLW